MKKAPAFFGLKFNICANVRLAVGLIFLVAFNSAQAEVRLPSLFTDHMVLQEETPVKIWGWADEGETVTVKFRDQTVVTVAKAGRWQVELKKLKAGGPNVLTVSGKNSIEINDVLVGEVWVASGQSNMEFHLRDSFEVKADIEAATNGLIHFFHVARLRGSLNPTTNADASWVTCSPANAGSISAVGYYFARDLQKNRGVPIGLIETDYGGSPAEAWMRYEFLEANYDYKHDVIDRYITNAEHNYTSTLAKFENEKAAAKANGQPFKQNAPIAPWRPAELYNGMLAPVIGYRMKGVIWYQGESNAGRAEQYGALFPDMIRNWRTDWQEGEFPFLIVQLAPFMAIKDQPEESSWAELREAQLKTTFMLPKTGVVVITDLGEPKDIHPKKKKPVGERLALAARSIAYDENIVWSGPIYRSFKIEGNKIAIGFDSIGKGLEARDGELKGFTICGKDRKFVWATATIEGKGKNSRVMVTAPQVEHPVAVRYGWANFPVVNLWNKDGLPASPFRTDNFPMVTADKR